MLFAPNELLDVVTNDRREFVGFRILSFHIRLFFGEPIDELFLRSCHLLR